MMTLNHTQLEHARDIVAAVRDRGLSRRHAVIAIETALTESRLRMYANRNNPASMALPHEAVGHDHGSVGLFQQQVGGAVNSTANWGTTAQLMDAGLSTGKFLDALSHHDLNGRSNWQAAQSVQHSAFADGRNYRANDAEARHVVDTLWDGPVIIGPTDPGDYVVRPGDTLSAIADHYGVTWRFLADLNHLADPDVIQPGQHLQVPATEPSPPDPPVPTSYTVVQGDTLAAIAERFHTTWPHLAQVNHLPDPDVIHPGQTLTVG